MPRESYEVYYFQNGRWSLHASFEAGQRDDAVTEAMGVESKLGLPSRVIRETFFEDTNTSEEVVTWQGTKGRKIGDADNMFGAGPASAPPPPARQGPRPTRAAPRPTAPTSAGGGRAPARGKAKKPPPKKLKRKKKQGPSFLTGLTIAIVIATAVSTLGAAAIALLTLQLQRTRVIGVFDSTPLIFGSFVLLFFMSLIFSLNRQFKLFKSLRDEPGANAPRAGRGMQPAAGVKRRAAPHRQDIDFDGVAVERGDAAADQSATDSTPESSDAESATDTDAPPELDSGESKADEAPPKENEASAGEQSEKPKAEKEEQKPAAEEKPAPKKEEPPKEAPKPNPEAEAKQIFQSFSGTAFTSATSAVGELNAFTKMGLNLFLAGGMSVFGQSKKLSRDLQISALQLGLQTAGNTPERSKAFCGELPSYGKNPKYAGMIKAGGLAMNKFLSGQPGAPSEIAGLLGEWALPEKRPAVPQAFTFMFTDLVGSTAMTHELGNVEAQKIVRAHNNAVRNALAQNKGREVKHTGDGIMAVFTDAPSAVQATIQMQREFAEHNAAFPNLPLTVRIGLNTGEAVEEENDFFGAAVQMSARVCAQAANGNVWVSQSTADACKGRKIGFIPRGQFKMKGIQGARTLYEVAWTEAHKTELADL
ncbi:MAG: hypothetical protein KDE14_09275 [Rhodobacteraceae bacterium]|nr:hypothetical protein [Paracoccaceae bacterium]